MAVQIWIGEKPENHNERRALTQLATSLARLDGLYVIMANFSVGGRTIDLVVLKREGFFVVELKHCDGRVIGDVNGPWFVENANKERKRINPGRKNPYNQVISYYYAFTNFLNDQRADITGTRQVETRSVRRVVAIAPSLHPDSQVDTDWKVQVVGLDELPAFVFTEHSADMQWQDDELERIPQVLHCVRWEEIESLIGEEAPPPALPPRARPITTQLLQTWTGQSLIGVSMVLLALAIMFVLSTRGTQLVTLPAMVEATAVTSPLTSTQASLASVQCVWRDAQTVARVRQRDGTWQSAPIGTSADVLLTLQQVNACDGEIRIDIQIINNTPNQRFEIPLSNAFISIRDTLGTVYEISESRSNPEVLLVEPERSVRGVVVVERGVLPTATTLLISLRNTAFGDVSWVVALDNQ
jgi:hypothetical protein